MILSFIDIVGKLLHAEVKKYSVNYLFHEYRELILFKQEVEISVLD